MPIQINSSDILILQCIYNCEDKKTGADLRRIIGFADYINHAIITYDEFVSCITKFSALGLLVQRDDHLHTTSTFKNWWKKKFKGKKTVSASKEYNEMATYLRSYESSDVDPSAISILISHVKFKEVVKTYTDSY